MSNCSNCGLVIKYTEVDNFRPSAGSDRSAGMISGGDAVYIPPPEPSSGVPVVVGVEASNPESKDGSSGRKDGNSGSDGGTHC